MSPPLANKEHSRLGKEEFNKKAIYLSDHGLNEAQINQWLDY